MTGVITVTTQPFDDPQTPTPTHYQQLAEQVMTAFETIMLILPQLKEAAAAVERQARRHLNVPDAFCGTAIVAVEQLPELEAAKKLHAEKSRNRMQFLDAFLPVDDKLDGLSRRLKHALRATKSALAASALQIYRIAQAQASDGRSPVVAAHVSAMKRDLGRKSQTRAEREERKAQKLRAAIAEALRNGTAGPLPAGGGEGAVAGRAA